MIRAAALLLLTSVAIVGFAPGPANAGAGTEGSRQIVIEKKEDDTKKAEPAKQEVKDEAPAKQKLKEEKVKDEPADEDAEAQDEAPAKVKAKAEEKAEAKDEDEPVEKEAADKPAKVIVKEEGDPAELIVKDERDKAVKALVKGKEEIVVKESDREEPPLVVVLQTELKRVGCYHGKIDGDWGPGSSEALADFYHYGKVSISKFEPTSDALALVKGKKGVVCLAHDSPEEDYGGYDSDGGYGSGGGSSDGY